MGKLKDVSLGIDWEVSPTHIVDFDPNVDTVTMEGKNGDYEAIPVKEGGQIFNLSLSNKTLVRALQAITKPCRLKITRTGTSYDTKYTVTPIA